MWTCWSLALNFEKWYQEGKSELVEQLLVYLIWQIDPMHLKHAQRTPSIFIYILKSDERKRHYINTDLMEDRIFGRVWVIWSVPQLAVHALLAWANPSVGTCLVALGGSLPRSCRSRSRRRGYRVCYTLIVGTRKETYCLLNHSRWLDLQIHEATHYLVLLWWATYST